MQSGIGRIARTELVATISAVLLIIDEEDGALFDRHASEFAGSTSAGVDDGEVVVGHGMSLLIAVAILVLMD